MIEYKKFNDKTGYLIYQIERVDLLKKLRDSFINNLKIAPKYKRNINSVRLSMAKMSSAEINRAMINFLTFNKNLSELMVKSCPKLIQKLCGKKLFIQRRAHTTINVPGNKFSYHDAKAVCKSMDAEMATYEQLREAQRTGASWCSYGWSKDQLGLYPTSQSDFLKLQKKEGHEYDCGLPGVNGGYVKNNHIL